MEKKTLIEKIQEQSAEQEAAPANVELIGDGTLATKPQATKPKLTQLFSNFAQRFKKPSKTVQEAEPLSFEDAEDGLNENLDLSNVFTDDEVDFTSATSFEDSLLESNLKQQADAHTIAPEPLSVNEEEAALAAFDVSPHTTLADFLPNQKASVDGVTPSNDLDDMFNMSEIESAAPGIQQAAQRRGVSIRQKLSFILLAASLPIFILLGLLWQSQNSTIQLTLEERQDLNYIQTNLDAVNNVLTNMFTAVDVATGQQPQTALDASLATVESNLAKIAEVTSQYGDRLETTEKVDTLFVNWESLKTDLPSLAVGGIFSRHSEFIRQNISAVTDQVIFKSNLILDPEPATYHSIDVLLNELSPFFENLADLRTKSLEGIESNAITPELQGVVSTLVSNREKDINTINVLLERAFEADNDFRVSFETKLRDAEKVARDGLSLTKQVILEGNPDAVTAEAYRTLMTDAQNGYLGLYGELLTEIDTLLEKRVTNSRQNQSITLLFIMLLIAAAVFAIFRIAQSITKPLQELVRVSSYVAKGDLSVLSSVEQTDEVGQLSQSFNQAILQLRESESLQKSLSEQQNIELESAQALQGNIANFLEVVMDIADGDFSKRGEVSNDVLGNVVDAINLMVDELSALLSQVQNSANSVNTGSSIMTNSTKAIAESSNVQTREAAEARKQLETLVLAIQEMAKRANASAKAAILTLNASQKGQEAVNDTLEGMNEIREGVQNVAERMTSLAKRSDEISLIVESVTHISSQINLLALSAALEAAGAGEAGARFAVLADEVQKLANESADSANQISDVIKDIQIEIKTVSAQVGSNNEKVDSGYQVATEAGERLKEIGAISKRSAQFANLISKSTKAQVSNVAQVNKSVKSISAISQSSQIQVQQGQEAAEQLKALSEQLTQSLTRFRLG